MSKRTFYALWTAIGLLFCLNGGLIGWLIWQPVRPAVVTGVTAAIGERVANRLKLSDGQRVYYEQAQRALREQLRPKEDSLRQLRARLFSELGHLSPGQVDSLIQQMEHQQGQLMHRRVRYWQQIRTLCTPEQRVQFDQLLTRLGERLNGPSGRMDRLRRRRE